MKRFLKISLIVFCILSLIMVRKLEAALFYDPFLFFFKNANYCHIPTPEFNFSKLITSLLFRYSINSILSLAIIQLWFNKKNITLFCLYIFGGSFIIFSALYLISIFTNFGLGYMPTFYIRRILIQPILLLILIPSIYYHQLSPKRL